MIVTVEKDVDINESKLIDIVHKHFSHYESKDDIINHLETEEGAEWLENALKELIGDTNIEITFSVYADVLSFLMENV